MSMSHKKHIDLLDPITQLLDDEEIAHKYMSGRTLPWIWHEAVGLGGIALKARFGASQSMMYIFLKSFWCRRAARRME